MAPTEKRNTYFKVFLLYVFASNAVWFIQFSSILRNASSTTINFHLAQSVFEGILFTPIFFWLTPKFFKNNPTLTIAFMKEKWPTILASALVIHTLGIRIVSSLIFPFILYFILGSSR